MWLVGIRSDRLDYRNSANHVSRLTYEYILQVLWRNVLSSNSCVDLPF